jgi:ABC-type multidrug transport system fused ATPase/permease subunit
MKVRPGERIALIGHNGAGKSTALALISGLYPATRGSVLLDGIPMSVLPDEWLHRQIAVVLQDTFLFSGTLAENIRYGRPEASDEQVRRAARDALVTEFSDGFPDGLRTELADGGVGLSGGQRQRVGIARALLLDAPIVLLDEPTAGLDVAAEELVVRALMRLAQGRTVIMTTHRPSVNRLATRTIYLRNGGAVRPPPRPWPPAPGHPHGRRPPPPPNGLPFPRPTPAAPPGGFTDPRPPQAPGHAGPSGARAPRPPE